jgi:hypothetical protein
VHDPRTDVADHHQGAVDALPDGVFLADWLSAKGIGRTAGFALLKIAKGKGFEPSMLRRAGVSKPSPFLSGHTLEAMDALAAEHQSGQSISTLEAKYSTAITHTPVAPPPAPLADVEDANVNIDDGALLRRLKAADLAIATGLPLSRAEISWILGRAPNSQAATNARIVIEQRTARSWALRAPADH